jgi:hypothetical protein
MTTHDEPDDEEQDDALFDEDDLYDDRALLGLIGRFGASLTRVPWFSALGARLDGRLKGDARDYLDALGFPDIDIALIGSFREAEDAATSPGFDDPAWEAEEQLRAALASEAAARFGEEAAQIALTHISARAAPAVEAGIERAAQLWSVRDENLLTAAAGAAIQAAHEAALVLAAGAGEDHAFVYKFRLFERGRWPISIAGASFNLF